MKRIKSNKLFDMETKKELLSKITQLKIKIKEQYPELAEHIEKMREPIADDKKMKTKLKDLKTYHDSLNSMLNKHILEHPSNIIKETGFTWYQ